MQNGSQATIRISPEIPKEIAGESFEVQLLGRMIDLVRTSTGYVVAPDARQHVEIDLKGLRRFSLDSTSPIVEAIRHVIDAEVMSHKSTTRDEIARAMGMERFDIEHLLQEICRQHEDSIPYFEVLWSLPSSVTSGGRAMSGAVFVTAEAISSLDASGWLAQQRQAHKHDAFQTRMDWNAQTDGRWVYPVPHSDWRQIAFGHEEDFVAIEKRAADSFEVSIETPGFEATEHVGFYPSLAKAMRAGGRVAYDIENSSDDKVLASMGLPDGEWELCAREGTIEARCLANPNLFIERGATSPGEFTLFNLNEEVAVLENPWELLQHLPQPAPSGR